MRVFPLLLALCLMAGGLAAAAQAASGAPVAQAPQGRIVENLGSGWRFRFGDQDVASVTTAAYDDSAWQEVELPHTWNRLGEYALVRSDDTDSRHGLGWYRRTLNVTVTPGRRRILQFDGVGAIADVWVNGVHVGGHRGAFSRFRLDITDQLRSGADNLLVVRADNSEPAPGSSTENVLPLGGDYFVHGGLYRNVSLIDAPDLQIDLFDHGGPGVYLTTPKVEAAGAEIEVLTRLRNAGTRNRRLSVLTSVRDADGRTVLSDRAGALLTARSTGEVRRRLDLASPHLWQGRADPYLYSVRVELREGGRLIDAVEEPLGIRRFAFDPDTGFTLNGRSVSLHGASRHQDAAGVGWALSDADHVRDMAIMAEMGVNTVRQAHYQHAEAFSDAADRQGMVVWAELPFIQESSLTNDKPTPALIENAREQLIELIRQNYNHPSIMIWAVGNEVDIAGVLERRPRPSQSLDMLKDLDGLARQEDPSRITAYADCCEETPLARPGGEILSGVTGIAGFNRYFGWYYGEPQTVGPALDGFHAKYPSTPIALSEYGAGGALTQHTDDPRGGPVASIGRPHPEEYQSFVHEQAWPQLRKRPYLAATWIWTMFDFASTSRQEGDAVDINDKGLVSYDRTLRKDAFYFYQANWTDTPMIHLTGRRYVDRAYPVTDVRAYTNAATASLEVNGTAVGQTDCPDHICVWPSVVLRPGENALVAHAVVGQQQVSDSLSWIAPDRAMGLHIDVGTLTGRTTPDGVRFGSDAFFEGGTARALNPQVLGPPSPARSVVAPGQDPGLYESWREGAFTYSLPLPDGPWLLTLDFAETDDALASSRTFSVVTGDGAVLLSHFNPAGEAKETLRAIRRSFPVTVRGGRLALEFRPEGGPAMVSAISISPPP